MAARIAVIWRRKGTRPIIRQPFDGLVDARGFAKFAHDQGHYVFRIEGPESYTRQTLLQEVFVDGKPLLADVLAGPYTPTLHAYDEDEDALSQHYEDDEDDDEFLLSGGVFADE